MKASFILLLLSITGLSLSGCDQDKHEHSKLATGKQLFESHCASCHSSSGMGSFVLGIPSNRDTKLLNIHIRKKIRYGSGPESNMPIFQTMPEKEAIKIVQYLRTLK